MSATCRRTSGEEMSEGFLVRIVRNCYNISYTVLLQNTNGPCPLLAITNVLLLRGDIQLSAKAMKHHFVLISEVFRLLLTYIASQHVHGILQKIPEKKQILKQLLALKYGLDVNIHFGDFKSCKIFQEYNIFDFFKISLVHGWITSCDSHFPMFGYLGSPEIYSYDDVVNYMAYHSELSNILRQIEIILNDEFHHIINELSAMSGDVDISDCVSNKTIFSRKNCNHTSDIRQNKHDHDNKNSFQQLFTTYSIQELFKTNSDNFFLPLLSTKQKHEIQENDVLNDFIEKLLHVGHICEDLKMPSVYAEEFVYLVLSRCAKPRGFISLQYSTVKMSHAGVIKKSYDEFQKQVYVLRDAVRRFFIIFTKVLELNASRNHIQTSSFETGNATQSSSTNFLTIQGFLNDIYRIEQFLQDTAQQLTITGLRCLRTSLPQREYVILFRNNHFSVIQCFNGQVYQLVTDAAYLHTQNIFWERLDDVYGSTTYYNIDMVPASVFYKTSLESPPELGNHLWKKRNYNFRRKSCFFRKRKHFPISPRSSVNCLIM